MATERTDLERAYEALSGKKARYDVLFNYYDGDQPLVYSTERLREVFQRLDARFEQNWCAVVVDSVLERLNLRGWDAPDKATNDALDAIWNANELELDAFDVHAGALITSEAFVVAWPGEDGEPEAYYNDPRLCHVFYDPEHPRVKRFAAKWWVGEDERLYLTLYYPDRLEYYVSTAKAENVRSANAFEAAGVEANPYGEVPVFHFRRNRRAGTSELANVVHVQDAINKLFADMMVAAEFGSFRQRWIISNADLRALKNAPNEIWHIPAGDGEGQGSQVGQFEATELENYLNAIDRLAGAIAIITHTPKHYLFSAGAGLSGDALIAMEAPLNHKCQQYQERFAVPWRKLAAFLLRLKGIAVDASEITPVWREARTVQPLAEAQARKTAKDAGIPLVTLLKREGWSADEIAQMQQDAREEKAQQQTLAQAMLAQAQRQFDRGQGADEAYPPGKREQREGERRARQERQ